MATLTVQTIVETGLEATTAACAAGGDVFDNSTANRFIYINNTSATNSVVTVTAANTSFTVPGYGSMTKADKVVTVTAGEIRFIGPFPKSAFNNTSSQVAIAYSLTTGHEISILALPAAS